MNDPVLIIGAGAIGSLVAAQLTQAGHRVVLLGRRSTAQAIEREGLRITQAGHTMNLGQVQVITSLAEAGEPPTAYRLAILAVKSYDIMNLAGQLKASTLYPLPLLTLQNGVGNEEALMARLGERWITAGVITTPASMPAPGHVIVERPLKRIGVADIVRTPTAAGGPALPATAVARLLRDAGFQVRVVQDWRSLKWTKLALNMICNASCALLDWSPAQVWQDRQLAQMEITAWQETLALIRALDCRLLNLAGYPLAPLEPLLRNLPPRTLRPILGRFIIGGRGGKMPSLHMDLASGLRRSEVRWLNGAVAQAGRALGMPTPANDTLYDTLLAVIQGEEPWERYRDRPQALLEQYRSRLLPRTAVRTNSRRAR